MTTASAGRGRAAYQQQANAANSQRAGGFASILLLKDGESVRARFRGLLTPPAYKYSQEELTEIAKNEEMADQLAAVLGMYPYFDTEKDFIEKVLERYTQEEPFVYIQHYIAGNKGPDAYLTCGLAEAEEPVIWDPPVDCVPCLLKSSGDKRISRRAQVAFSLIVYRKTHRIKSTIPGHKDKFETCTMDEQGYCALCAGNNEARQEGMRYISLSQSHAGLLFACADNVGKRCAVCGIGTLSRIGWACGNPECGEPLPNPIWAQLATEKVPIVCKACNVKNMPIETLRCPKGCENPRRCQLHDVDIEVQRVGSSKKTSYAFTPQWPAEPLNEDMLKFRLPSYENRLKPKNTDQQSRQCGLHENPFTNKPVGTSSGVAESYDENEERFSDEESQDGEDSASYPFANS